MTSPPFTGFQPLPNEAAQFIQLNDLSKVSVKGGAGLPKRGFGSAEPSQDFDRLRSPEQLGQSHGVDRRVCLDWAVLYEINGAARPGGGHLDAPPVRNHGLGLLGVLLANHQS